MRFLHFLLVTAAALAALPVVAQTSDTTPPQMVSMSFTPSAVDVSVASKTVIVDANITDNLSGLSYGYVYFTSPRGQTAYAYLNRLSGNALAGTYRGTASIPVYAESGVWKAAAYAYDNAGNRLTLSTAALGALGFPTDLAVTNTVSDTAPPALLGITFEPTTVDVSSASAEVIINLHVTDNLSGAWSTNIGWFAVGLQAPGTAGNSNVHYLSSRSFRLISGTAFDGIWQAVTTIPRYSPAGAWKVQYVTLYDNVGNYVSLGNAQLAAAGINPTLSVASAPADSTPPVLTGLALSPPLFNTSAGAQNVTLTVNATDDVSGVSFAPTTPDIAYIQFSFSSPSGNQSVYVSPFSSPALVGGTPLSGTWQLSANWPRYSEEGTWKLSIYQFKDAAGNFKNYTPAMLQSMGLPNSVVVTKPSLVTDGTVGSSGGTVMDNSFGNRASVTFPPGVAPDNTGVSIDVFASALSVPTPQGFTMPGTYFTNISFAPSLPSPLPSPGITIVLPLLTPLTPGARLSLFHIDPVSGTLAPAMNAFYSYVIGTVNADGVSATFFNVVTLSTVVAYLSNGSLMGDVDGNGVVNCVDVTLVKASFGKLKGKPQYNSAADLNNDGVVDIRDLFLVTRQLPPGTICQ